MKSLNMDLPTLVHNASVTNISSQGVENLVPGLFFFFLSFGWSIQTSIQCAIPIVKTASSSYSSSSSSCLSQLRSSLPLSGLYKVTLTSLSILSTVIQVDTDSIQTTGWVTTYISFSVCGLLDIIIFYWSANILPKHMSILYTTIAFLVEYLAVSGAKDDDIARPVTSCLVLAICSCLISSVSRIISSSSITTFSLIMFTQIQGTWLLHSAFLNCSEKMSYLYFSWHVLAVFMITLVASVITHLHASTTLKLHMTTKHHTLTSKMYSRDSEAHTGLTVLRHSDTNSDNVADVADNDDIYHEKNNREQKLKEDLEIINVLKTIDIMVGDQASKEMDYLRKVYSNTKTEKAESNKNLCERVSPLDEFNTLHRNVSGVRASIKLKESDIV